MYIVLFLWYTMYIIEKVSAFLRPLTKGSETMTELTAKTKYNMEYAKTKLKRIPLDVQKEKYEEIKLAADAAGESVNGYIKSAIDQRMERDQIK